MSTDSSMDVDPPVARTSSNVPEETHISIHPLAIVHMSDQYTRVTCGGSPLSPSHNKDAPVDVVGLLFGLQTPTSSQTSATTQKDATVLDIRDADDIPTTLTPQAQTQVSLHQAVFPMHSVVGWYRVVVMTNDDDSNHPSPPAPTVDDLTLTRQLQQHYQQHNNMTNNPTHHTSSCPFVFLLLQVPGETMAPKAPPTGTTAKSLPLPQQQQQRPLLTLYQVRQDDNMPPVLVAHSHWNLHTSESERIAVERVVRERPHSNNHHHPQNDTSSMLSCSYKTQLESVQQAMQVLQERLGVLVEFLQQCHKGVQDEPPPPWDLLRRVQTLVCHLGPLAAMTSSTSDNTTTSRYQTSSPYIDPTTTTTLLFAHLATVSQTVGAVRSYMDKVQKVKGHGTTASARRAATRRA